MEIAFVILLAGLSVLSFASSRSLQQAPVPAPAPDGDAIVSIIDPSGVATAAVPVIDGTNLKVSPTDVTVVKPDGKVQAVMSLHLASGNSTITVQPSLTSTGVITISQPNGPSTQVSLVPRPGSAAAPAPGVPADLRANLGLMPQFYDWGGSYNFMGSFPYTDVSVSGDSGSGSGSVDISAPSFMGMFSYSYGN